MGFKHVVKSDITSVVLTGGSFYPETYLSEIVGKSESSTELMRITGNNASFDFSFGDLVVPSDAIITKIWCNISANGYRNGSPSRDLHIAYSGGSISGTFSMNTWLDSSDTLRTATIDATDVVSVNRLNTLKLRMYAHYSTAFGTLGGATMYVEYEDDTPESHGIFNTTAPTINEGGHIAVWTSPDINPTNSTRESISFNVSGQPTSWLLICAGPSDSFTSVSNVGYYIVVTAEYTTGTLRAVCGNYYYYMRQYRSTTSNVTQSYNSTNKILTLTGTSGYRFINTSKDPYTYPATYYLLYNL